MRHIGHNTHTTRSCIGAILICTALLLGSCGGIGQGDDPIGSNSAPEDASRTPPVTYDEMTAEEHEELLRLIKKYLDCFRCKVEKLRNDAEEFSE